MAKARIAQPPSEVARIVFYYEGLQSAFMVRYADMKAADKQYMALLDARKNNRNNFVLNGAAGTVMIHDVTKVVMSFLIAVEQDRYFAVDEQRRMQALMQLP